jgi:hypothetical protein
MGADCKLGIEVERACAGSRVEQTSNPLGTPQMADEATLRDTLR